MAVADFFTTDVWTWRGLVTLYTAFTIDLASRRVQILGSTPHPEALFMEQVVRRLAMAEDGSAPVLRVLICDRDRKWSGDVWSSRCGADCRMRPSVLTLRIIRSAGFKPGSAA
jgi:hypothetical protein